MRRAAAILSGYFLICGLGLAAAQDLPYPGDAAPEDGISGYIALRGSLNFADKGTNATIPSTPAATALRPSHAIGGGAAVAVGANLPYGFRVEAEGLYRRRPVNGAELGGTAVPAGGALQTAATMANLIWAPQIDGLPIRPLIGGGAGMAYTYGRVSDPVGATQYLQPGGWHFAYQGMAGVEIPVLPGASLTATYRWTHTDNVKAKCGTAGAATLACSKFGYYDQGLDLGLKIDLP